MSELKAKVRTLTAAIEAKHQERASVDSELDRIEAIAAQGDALTGELDAMRTKRRAAVAQALLEQREPDLREFDATIGKLEKTSATARSQADAAPVVIEQLRDQLAAIDDQLADLVQQRRTAARAWLDERYVNAEGAYAQALDAFGVALCQLAALEQLRDRPLLAVADAPHVFTSALQLLNALNERAPLLTPHRFSWLTDESFWGWNGVPPTEEGNWSRPHWLPMPVKAKEHPSAAAERALCDELRALGIDPDWRPARPAPAILAQQPFAAPAGVTVQTVGGSPVTIGAPAPAARQA